MTCFHHPGQCECLRSLRTPSPTSLRTKWSNLPSQRKGRFEIPAFAGMTGCGVRSVWHSGLRRNVGLWCVVGWRLLRRFAPRNDEAFFVFYDVLFAKINKNNSWFFLLGLYNGNRYQVVTFIIWSWVVNAHLNKLDGATQSIVIACLVISFVTMLVGAYFAS